MGSIMKYLKLFEEYTTEVSEREFVEKVAEAYDYDIVRKLGQGYNGVAYLLNDQKVLKITTDKSETDRSFKLVNKKTNNIVNIYKVEKIDTELNFKMKVDTGIINTKNRDIYAIIMDFVDTLDKSEKLIFGWMEGRTPKLDDDYIEEIIEEIILETKLKYDFIKPYVIKMMNALIGVRDDMEEYDIYTRDIQIENCGWDLNNHDKLMFFDIGGSEIDNDKLKLDDLKKITIK